MLIGKLETTTVDLSDVVKNEIVKKTVYDKLNKNVNAIQTTDTNNLKQVIVTQTFLKLKETTWSWLQ